MSSHDVETVIGLALMAVFILGAVFGLAGCIRGDR